MSYLGELRTHIRPLAAASLGVGTSLPLFSYTNGVFAPFLIKDFGWSRAEFALVGLTVFASVFTLPFVGRFTDLAGVRRVAMMGTALLPFCFIAYSQMAGSLIGFLLIYTAVLVIGCMNGALVYTRLIAENFERARGLALTVVNCAPAVIAMAAIPLLNIIIEDYGWRSAYLGLGTFCCVCGIVAVWLTPPAKPREPLKAAQVRQNTAREDFRMILRSRVTWVLLAGFALCLLQIPLHATQMNLMLLDNGLTPQLAANVVAIYAFGTIVGRILCGLALDRFDAPIVSAVSMGIPAIGYLFLATPLDALPVIMISMFLIGLSVGAESDLISFLVARYFKLRIFNSALSVVVASIYLASAAGALMASAALHLTNSFAPLLYLVSGAVIVGSVLFMLLPKSGEFEKIG